MAQSTKLPRFTTPEGEAVYPHLHRPDTKFHDAGIYSADLRVPATDAKGLMAELSKAYKAHVGSAIDKNSNNLWTVEKDDDGDPTGNVVFRLRVKNVLRKDGEMWERKPKLFDTSEPPKPIAVEPWGGTKMIVAFDLYSYEMPHKGMNLQPRAIQIIDLKTGGDDGASDYGFSSKEGGFKDAPSQEEEEYFDMSSEEDTIPTDF